MRWVQSWVRSTLLISLPVFRSMAAPVSRSTWIRRLREDCGVSVLVLYVTRTCAIGVSKDKRRLREDWGVLGVTFRVCDVNAVRVAGDSERDAFLERLVGGIDGPGEGRKANAVAMARVGGF